MCRNIQHHMILIQAHLMVKLLHYYLNQNPSQVFKVKDTVTYFSVVVLALILTQVKLALFLSLR